MKVNSHVLFECRLKPFKILEASQPVNCVPAFSEHHSLLSFHRCKHKNTSFCTHTHKYFPKVRNNSVRKALFYQRTGCSDKLNILRIIICTYQGSCHQASYSLSTEKAESPHCLLNCSHPRNPSIGSMFHKLWEMEIYIRKEKKEAFTNENFSSCSRVFITGLFLHWP